MSSAKEICSMNAVSLAKQIRSKELSAVEVVEAVLGRMEKLEPTVHAFCTPTPELARARAKEVQAD
ncbi:MAG: amidase, partial [Betaproteobacteria bacterium]